MRSGCLADFVEFAYGKALPERTRRPGLVPVFGSAGRLGNHDEFIVEGPGVIVGRKGNVGTVHWSDDDFYPIDTTYYVVPKSKELRLRYVYYLLKALPLRHMNTDVAVPGLNRINALRLAVAIPSTSAQERIASILAAYDDLIENNLRRIQLLEESARLLFKECFVHLRFPGHEHTKITNGVPEGWERKVLGEIAPLHYGKALKEDDRVPGPYPVYGSSGIVGTHEKSLVAGPAIIVGRKGNVGSVYWSEEDFYPIDTVYYISPSQSSYYLFHALRHMSFISTDVAVPGLNRDFAHSRQILLPAPTLGKFFEEIVGASFKQVHNLTQLNHKLAAARDLILPRLMRGEIVI